MLTTNFGSCHAAKPSDRAETMEAGSSVLQKLYLYEDYLAPGMHTCIIKQPASGACRLYQNLVEVNLGISLFCVSSSASFLPCG